MTVHVPDLCRCGDPECWHWSADYRGYPFCRPCGDHHRAPECAVDEHGRALRPDGTPWCDTNPTRLRGEELP